MLPVVLTSSIEQHAQGPLLSELEQILPAEFASRVQRLGIVNAMDDENFAAVVKAGSWATPEGGQLVQVLMTALQD